MNGIVCLDAGHGGQDNGASRGIFYEKNLALNIVRELNKVLNNQGTVAVLTRDHDVFVPLGERCRIANEAGAAVFVSIHLNADPDPDAPGMPEAVGQEVWYCESSGKGKALAEELGEVLRRQFSEWRGTHGTGHLYVLKHTKMPAVLIEVGFVDSTHDATLLSQTAVQQDLALGIAGALESWAAEQLPPETSSGG